MSKNQNSPIMFAIIIALIVFMGVLIAMRPISLPEQETTPPVIQLPVVQPVVIPTPPTPTTNPIVKVPPGTFYVPILMYHHIQASKYKSPYRVSPIIFDQQMAWLHNNNYHVIRYDDFYQALMGKITLPENPVVITFDDGDPDQYQNALPILKKYGMTAMFFIYTKAIGPRSGMSWEMVQEMVNDGMEIGSHSVSHPNLAVLDLAQLRMELTKSKQIIEDKLGIPINYFAYPGGANSLTVQRETQVAGYVSAVTTVHSVFHEKDENPYLVKRIHIDNDMDSFVKFVTGVKKD